MEIELGKKPSFKHKKSLLALAAVLALSVFWVTQERVPSVDEGEAELTSVSRGDMDIFAQAFGEFASVEERMLTSQASGKVSAIFLRPGAKVSTETVIMSLINPELKLQYESAQGELASKQAQLASFELEQQSNRLDFKGRIADIEAALEKSRLDLTVNKELSERGVSAKLEILKAELNVKQQTKKLAFEREKYSQYIRMQKFQLKQKQVELEQQQQQVDLLARQMEDLDVKAGINGRLQQLNFELGESVPQGASLGKVGSDENLLAKLRVPQIYADQISVGSKAQLITKKGRVTGYISRIESVVNNGSVLAEVQLEGQAPIDARPSGNVTGQIFIQTKNNALFVKQTTGLRPRSKVERFVANSEKGNAQKRTISLGEVSQGYVEVLEGLDEGELMVAKMPDEWRKFNTITIN